MGVLALLTVVGPCAPPAARTDGVVLFDCAGRIQRIDVGEAVEAGRARHVSELDSALPDRVVDGCSIHSGWYDEASGDLHLVVQTEATSGVDGGLPVKTLRIAATLDSAVGSAGTSTTGATQETLSSALRKLSRADVATVLARLETVESPFARSVGYPSSDGSTILLQEVEGVSGEVEEEAVETRRVGPPGVRLAPMWRAGEVSFRPAHESATGRYALMSLETGRPVGAAAGSTADAGANRVLCHAPEGRIYLTEDDDVLSVLDTAHPDRRATIPLELDLAWSGCAFVPARANPDPDADGGPSAELDSSADGRSPFEQAGTER